MPASATAKTIAGMVGWVTVFGFAFVMDEENPVFGDRREVPVFWNTHWEAPAHRGLAEALACQDVLIPAPPRPTVVARAWTWLATLVRHLGRSPGDVVVGRVVPGSEPSVAK